MQERLFAVQLLSQALKNMQAETESPPCHAFQISGDTMTYGSRRKSALVVLSMSLAFLILGVTLAAPVVTAQQAIENAAPPTKDRTQWRKLQRRMSKDDVKKLLGDPPRVSVSRYYESWDYLGGTVTFDSKGRLDFWSEA